MYILTEKALPNSYKCVEIDHLGKNLFQVVSPKSCAQPLGEPSQLSVLASLCSMARWASPGASHAREGEWLLLSILHPFSFFPHTLLQWLPPLFCLSFDPPILLSYLLVISGHFQEFLKGSLICLRALLQQSGWGFVKWLQLPEQGLVIACVHRRQMVTSSEGVCCWIAQHPSPLKGL